MVGRRPYRMAPLVQHAEDPVRPLRDDRDEAAQGIGGRVATDALVGDGDPVARPPEIEQAPQDLHPGLEGVGDAVAQADDGVPRSEREAIDAVGEPGFGKERRGRLARVGVESIPDGAVGPGVEAIERREVLVAWAAPKKATYFSKWKHRTKSSAASGAGVATGVAWRAATRPDPTPNPEPAATLAVPQPSSGPRRESRADAAVARNPAWMRRRPLMNRRLPRPGPP